MTPDDIQREMLRLEADFEKQPPAPGPPIDRCIAQLVGFEGDIDLELDPLLLAECRRAVRLANGHYREWVDPTPLSIAAIGFLQGVTFAAAVRNLSFR